METSAILLGNYPSGSPEWHELRNAGIGGSDIAAICGLSKWSSFFTTWAYKTGRIVSDETTESMEWGNRLESVIFAKFAEEHPELKLEASPGTYHHPDREWQRANPDGFYETVDGRSGILEIKTAMYEDDWRDGVPIYYEAQVQWYLHTFDLTHAYVAVLFHGNKYQEFEVQQDAMFQAGMLEQAILFRNHVETDTQPSFDGSTSTLETLRTLHPEIEDREVDLTALGYEYQDALKVAQTADYALSEVKARVLDAMGNARYGICDGVRVFTRQSRNGGKPFLIHKTS